MLTCRSQGYTLCAMSAIEFTTELTENAVLKVPEEVAQKLPKAGKARVIIITNGAADDADWQRAAYEQFLRDDATEEDIYDSLR